MTSEEAAEFRDYVARRLPALARLAYLLTTQPADADDLVQAALTKVYVAWSRVRRSDDVDAYVRAVVVNTHRSLVRRRRVRETLVPFVPERANPSTALSSVDDRGGLAAALATLPPRQRAVVVLRYCEDLSEAQVAAALGCSVGTVKSQAAKGLAKLRDCAAVAGAVNAGGVS